MNYFERVKKRLSEATLENSKNFDCDRLNGVDIYNKAILYKDRVVPLTQKEIDELYILGMDVINRLEKEYEDGYFDDL